MDELVNEYLGQTVVGGIFVAVGLVLISLERRARGHIGVEVFLIFVGLAIVTAQPLIGKVDPHQVRLVERLDVGLDVLALAGSSSYLWHLIRTTRMGERARRSSLLLLGTGVGAVLVYGVLGFANPAGRLNDFIASVGRVDGVLGTGDFWMFASPCLVAVTMYVAAWLVLSQQNLDPGERARAEAYAYVSGLAGAGLVAEPRLALTLFALSFVALLYGVLRYLFVRGEQAAFLSRFLSPQVFELVRLRGLQAVMKPQELELTVVCIDFRGFTSYTEAIPTQAVIDLISDYHEAIAPVVAEHDGMIKDYAGDGILILVGAPIPRPDHAEAALALARDAMIAAMRVIQRWGTGPHPLGVGIGVATGRVTVGAIGETAQMEYTCVGTAVNLAARLCAAAEDSTILIDANLAVTATGATPRGEIALKGLSNPVNVFELKSNPEARAVAGETIG